MANQHRYIYVGNKPGTDYRNVKLFYLEDGLNSLTDLIEDTRGDLSEVAPGSEARDISTNKSWTLGSDGQWVECGWYGPEVKTTTDVAKLSYVQAQDKAVLAEAKEYANSIAGAATANIKVVDTKPTTPEKNTVYYVGTTNPYDIYFYDKDLVEHSMGSSNPSLVDYQRINDNSLMTASKTIPSAINELNHLITIKPTLNGVPISGDKTGRDYELLDNSNLKDSIINIVYPIGSIYMSTNDISPATFLGGTWEAIEDEFLLSSGTTYHAGATGGNSSIEYTPKGRVAAHSHKYGFKFGDLLPNRLSSWLARKYNADNTVVDIAPTYGSLWSAPQSSTEVTTPITTSEIIIDTNTEYVAPDFTGTKEKLSTMPPYLVVYMWKRVS